MLCFKNSAFRRVLVKMAATVVCVNPVSEGIEADRASAAFSGFSTEFVSNAWTFITSVARQTMMPNNRTCMGVWEAVFDG